MAAGAIGCSVGRNIFMHSSPEAITRALSRVIRERWTAEKALRAGRGFYPWPVAANRCGLI